MTSVDNWQQCLKQFSRLPLTTALLWAVEAQHCTMFLLQRPTGQIPLRPQQGSVAWWLEAQTPGPPAVLLWGAGAHQTRVPPLLPLWLSVSSWTRFNLHELQFSHL